MENRRSSIEFIDVSLISRADEYFYVEKTGCTVFQIYSKNLGTLKGVLKKLIEESLVPEKAVLSETLDALQRQNAENLKQIFPEKEYRGLSPNFHIHVSVSELYIPMTGLPFLLEEICGPILGIYKWVTDT